MCSSDLLDTAVPVHNDLRRLLPVHQVARARRERDETERRAVEEERELRRPGPLLCDLDDEGTVDRGLGEECSWNIQRLLRPVFCLLHKHYETKNEKTCLGLSFRPGTNCARNEMPLNGFAVVHSFYVERTQQEPASIKVPLQS